MKISSGIYKIECLANGKVYIGQSQNIQNRWRAHKNALRAGKHGNSHLQRSWDLYGETGFLFTLLHEGSENLDSLEMQYMESYSSLNPAHGYNLEHVIEGVKAHSPETRAKISAGNRGKTVSPETRERLRLANQGKKASKETLEKQRVAGRLGKGKPKPPGFGSRVSLGLTGRKRSPEHCLHLSEAKRGVPLSDAALKKARLTLAQIHESRKGKPLPETTRRKISEANKGRHLDGAEREKRSLALRGRPKTPEHIAAAVAGKRKAKEKRCHDNARQATPT